MKPGRAAARDAAASLGVGAALLLGLVVLQAEPTTLAIVPAGTAVVFFIARTLRRGRSRRRPQ